MSFYPTGIAAANYSHVNYFQSRDLYDEFYGILLRIVKIAVASFAVSAQNLLIAYLEVIDPPAAVWYRDNWCGERGRYCLCHAGYGGSNNNMGVEVDWRDIKKLCPSSATLGTFIGHLIHFVRNLGIEHENFLKEQGTPGEFIRNPVPTKVLWDMIQDFHPKTLATSFIVEGTGGQGLVESFEKLNSDILHSGLENGALHLKIEAWHEAMTQAGESSPIKIGSFRTILMPRQSLLKRLDPDHSRPVADIRRDLHRFANQYHNVVLLDKINPAYTITDVLDIYERFHVLTRATNWSPVPMKCSCEGCNKNCLCGHSLLVGSVFDSSIKVPAEYISSIPSERKRTRMLKGTEGPRRQRLQLAIAEERKQSAE